MYEFKFVRTEPEMFKVLSPDFNCIENKNPGDSSVLQIICIWNMLKSMIWNSKELL